jgi:hypothetical protein
MWNMTIDQFIALRVSANRPSCYVWCTDGCTFSPDYFPPGTHEVDFQYACARHDFSYRNLKRYQAFTDATKLATDNHLRDAMIDACGTHQFCATNVTNLYYSAVRDFEKDASQYNTWTSADDAKTNCTVFPGCCADHSSSGCGSKGDGSCKAQ